MVLLFQALKNATTLNKIGVGGYQYTESKYLCVPVNADRINELTEKVKEAAKAIGANLVCGGTIERYDDRKHTDYDYDTCYLYFYGPAYHYV